MQDSNLTVLPLLYTGCSLTHHPCGLGRYEGKTICCHCCAFLYCEDRCLNTPEKCGISYEYIPSYWRVIGPNRQWFFKNGQQVMKFFGKKGKISAIKCYGKMNVGGKKFVVENNLDTLD